jgi:YEATS domain-contaning protein 2
MSNHLAGGTTERTQKIMKIIDREFSKNITNKTQEIFQIEERLTESKKLLAKVRYAVVASFYGKQAQTSEKKITETQINPSPATSSTTQPVQQQIHPSLKKLIGKTPINYDEILSIRPPREAAKTAASTIKEKLLSKKEEMKIKRMKGMLSAQAVAAVGEKVIDVYNFTP